MSLHAYRNIGFRFIEQEAACAKWRKLFEGADTSLAEQALELKADQNFTYITYFGIEYRLNRENGILEKKEDDCWSEDLFMNEALVLYHALGDTKEIFGRQGSKVPEGNLDPVSIRHSDRIDPLLKAFSANLSGQLSALEKRCKQLGGEKLDKGDCAYRFYPFRQIPIDLVFWEADDEFPAQTNVYVDEFCTDYMHFEAVGCMVADLLQKLEQSE